MKCAILLVAYGTNTPQGQVALKQFDARVRRLFPLWPVRWAFSSHLLRERLARAKRKSDWLTESDYNRMIETYDRVKDATGIIN